MLLVTWLKLVIFERFLPFLFRRRLQHIAILRISFLTHWLASFLADSFAPILSRPRLGWSLSDVELCLFLLLAHVQITLNFGYVNRSRAVRICLYNLNCIFWIICLCHVAHLTNRLIWYYSRYKRSSVDPGLPLVRAIWILVPSLFWDFIVGLQEPSVIVERAVVFAVFSYFDIVGLLNWNGWVIVRFSISVNSSFHINVLLQVFHWKEVCLTSV